MGCLHDITKDEKNGVLSGPVSIQNTGIYMIQQVIEHMGRKDDIIHVADRADNPLWNNIEGGGEVGNRGNQLCLFPVGTSGSTESLQSK